MIIFFEFDWKLGMLRHAARHVALCRGEQGIPRGFELTARCGTTSEQRSLDLEPGTKADADDCPSCFPKESKSR